jgi:hypothetical protein
MVGYGGKTPADILEAPTAVAKGRRRHLELQIAFQHNENDNADHNRHAAARRAEDTICVIATIQKLITIAYVTSVRLGKATIALYLS